MSRKPITLEFCRAELNAPTCVIPNGHMIRVIGGAEAPIGVVSPGGGTLASRQKMKAYAHTFAAGPRMLAALEAICDGASWSLGGPRRGIVEIDFKLIEDARAAVAAAHGVHK